MAATVTLSTTSLAFSIGVSDTLIAVASTSGMTPGVRLWIDKELMTFIRETVSPWIQVARGVDGTASSAHSGSSTITIGRADQFYQCDPKGSPDPSVPVQPWINITNGKVWWPYGDEISPALRWWQEQSTTYPRGPLGIVQVTTVGVQS